jgi:hypothetical protein
MAPLYWFSPSHVDDALCQKRWNKQEFADFGTKPHRPSTPPPEAWRPPPLRAHYRRLGLPTLPPGVRLDAARPLIVVHNKHSHEWSQPALNFFSERLLGQLARVLGASGLQWLYMRHSREAGFDDVGSPTTPFGDYEFLRAVAENGSAPGLIFFDDVALANPGMPLNEVQLRLLAAAGHAVSVQGGPALLLAQFCHGGDLVVLHKRGREVKSGEYTRLFRRFDGVHVTVAHTDEQLLDAVTRLAPLWAVD